MITESLRIKKDSWTDWVQLILVGLLAPFFLFPSLKYTWILLLVPSIWIWRFITKKKIFERSILDWAIFILVFQVFATCLIVPDLAYSLPKITGVLFGIAFFYSITALLKTEKLINAGNVLFLSSGLILSFIGILSMTSSKHKHFDELLKVSKSILKINFKLPGIESSLHPNALGGTLVLIIPLYLVTIFLYIRRKKQCLFKHKKHNLFFIFALIGLLITSGVFLLTQSRSSWIGLLLSGCLLLLPRRYGIKWVLLLIFLFVTAYLVFLGFHEIHYGIQEAKDRVEIRIQLWNVGIETIGKHPVFGIGMNRIRQLPSVGYERSHVHNHLIHTAAELGIPGLIAYLAILIGACFMCYKIWHRSNGGWMRMTALGLGWGQLGHLIYGITDSIPFGAKLGIFFWFSLALIAAMYNYTINNG